MALKYDLKLTLSLFWHQRREEG